MQGKLFCTTIMQSYWNNELYNYRGHVSFSLGKDFHGKKKKQKEEQTQQKTLKLSLPIPKQVHLVTQIVTVSQRNVFEKKCTYYITLVKPRNIPI